MNITQQKLTFINGPQHGTLYESPEPLEEGHVLNVHVIPEVRSYPEDIDIRYRHFPSIARYQVSGKYAYYLGESVIIPWLG